MMEELKGLQKECLRLSTALAVARQHSKQVDTERVLPEEIESNRDVKQATVDQLTSVAVEKLNEIESNYQSKDNLFEHEIERLTNLLTEREREISELRSRESVHGLNHTQPRNSSDQVISLIHESNNQAIRDQLRQKDEQLSRILAQHVSTQALLTDAEKEIGILREAQKLGTSYESLYENVKYILREPIEKCDDVHRALLREINQRDSYIQIILGDLQNLQIEYQKLEANRISFNDVLRNVQDDMAATKRELSADLRRARLLVPGFTSSFANLELDDLKKRVQCTLCKVREKSVVLTSCMHCYCRECVNEKMISARNRKCPLCMQKFSESQVKDVHFLHA
jgi:E3 ubiquitin-protein ligase BRE1